MTDPSIAIATLVMSSGCSGFAIAGIHCTSHALFLLSLPGPDVLFAQNDTKLSLLLCFSQNYFKIHFEFFAQISYSTDSVHQEGLGKPAQVNSH